MSPADAVLALAILIAGPVGLVLIVMLWRGYDVTLLIRKRKRDDD